MKGSHHTFTCPDVQELLNPQDVYDMAKPCQVRQLLRLMERYNPVLRGSAVKDYHINIFWSDEDGGYIADIPDLDACSAFGATPQEALAELEQAKAAWLEAARAEGRPVPEPRYRAPPRRSV